MQTYDCDVIIAGGSLSSLAAAITAANVSAALAVCYTELTDWPGGQMTSSGVPAIDFGVQNKAHTANVPASLRMLLYGPLMPGDTNPGECWVSSKCFQPQVAMERWILPLVQSFPNLRYLERTAVLATMRGASGAVTSITAVQRTPAPGTNGWEALTSTQLQDWYDPTPSAMYPSKSTITLNVKPGGVVVEATEFGDVLVTGGIPFAQGVEAPMELSSDTITTCGQGITLPLYIQYSKAPAPVPDPVPLGIKGRQNWTMQGKSWAEVWTYRRVHAAKANVSSQTEVTEGDLSNQNIGGGNDFIDAYIYLDSRSPEFRAQLQPGAWRGGVNLTTYAAAEQRAFAFYHMYINSTTVPAAQGHLYMNATPAGTASGLARLPYLRDSRRAASGLDGFRLTAADLWTPDPATGNRTTARWPDTVGLGVYFYADIHKMANTSCTYPAYIQAGKAVLPYYFPFRSLATPASPNLLLAGKSLAQTFFANAATRLHPEEWTTGCAAGAAAALMVQRGWESTQQVMDNVGELQALLASEAVGLPLTWVL